MPLLLESAERRQRLEFAIVGYEFPDPREWRFAIPNVRINLKPGTSAWDWNWLQVRVSVQDENDRLAWSATAPAMLTWDVEWCADWLEALGRGRATDPGRHFLEPCIAFYAYPHPDTWFKRLQVRFGLELYPFRGSHTPTADNSDVYLEFDLTLAEFRAAARQLRTELSRYPVRTVPAPGESAP